VDFYEFLHKIAKVATAFAGEAGSSICFDNEDDTLALSTTLRAMLGEHLRLGQSQAVKG
jgi:hypothetical protein